MKHIWRGLCFLALGFGLAWSSPAAGVPKLSGDFSHRFWVKTETENSAGKVSTRRVSAERFRFMFEDKLKHAEWRFRIGTIDPARSTASIIPLGREGDTVLGPHHFQIIDAYWQWNLEDGWKVRLGRTGIPFFKYRSELLFDNDIFWDGLFIEKTIPWGQKTTAHAGAFTIKRKIYGEGDRLYVFGAMGLPKWGKVQGEWRIDRFQYGIESQGWANTFAPGYRVVNLYGALEWPSQIRVTADWSRNLAANAPVSMHSGGDAYNLTLLLGKLVRDFTSQVIMQYFKVGPHAVPGSMVWYDKRVNIEGISLTYKFRVSKRTDIELDFFNFRRLESSFATDQKYLRWELMLNHRF